MLQKNRSQSLRNRLYAGRGHHQYDRAGFSRTARCTIGIESLWGISDHLVAELFIDLGIDCGASVIDPFCGSGTTAVESMKRGIACWAVDANPMACFATRVKTTWDLDVAEIKRAVEEVVQLHPKARKEITELRSDKTYQYLKKTGMLDRGWISPGALYDVIALKRLIWALSVGAKCRDFLLLALSNELVRSASNVKFGPELYCVKPKRADVVRAFTEKISAMSSDLELGTDVDRGESPPSKAIRGLARSNGCAP